MKAKDLAKQYGIDNTAFQTWMHRSGYAFKTGAMGGMDITDGQNFDEIVAAFKRDQIEQQELATQEAARQQVIAQQRQEALASMLITPGFSFDGYTITKYSGYISGDHAVQVNRGTDSWFGGSTDVGAALMGSLVEIRRQALQELKEAALALGCNAIIGVDFDYITLEPETSNTKGGTTYLPYVFGVTANGNAVVIEKNRATGLA